MENIRNIALYLLTLITGMYAGIHFSELMAPVVQKMDVQQYTQYWQLLDGYMGKRMPAFGMMFLLLFAVNIILFIQKWRSPVFWILIVCLSILIFDIVFTGKEQIPINQYIQSVNASNLTMQQLQTISEMKIKAENNFSIRDFLSIGSFFLMACTPFLLKKENESQALTLDLADKRSINI